MNSQSEPRSNPPPRRQYCRVSVRTLLIAITVACLAVAYLAHVRQVYTDQAAAIHELRAVSKAVVVSSAQPGSFPGGSFLVGEKQFVRVKEICLSMDFEKKNSSKLLGDCLSRLPWLETIDGRWVGIDDSGLAAIAENAKCVKHLWLYDGNFSNSGLDELAQLECLVDLRVGIGTKQEVAGGLTGECLVPISKITTLRHLAVCVPAITSQDLTSIFPLYRLEKLDVSDTAVDDSAIDTFARISTLQELDISFTRMTASGVETLRERLPSLSVESEGIGASVDRDESTFLYSE